MRLFSLLLSIFVTTLVPTITRAGTDDTPTQKNLTPPSVATPDVDKAIQRGLDFLRSTQNKDGGWSGDYGPAVTAIVANAFTNDPHHGPHHVVVRRAVAAIVKFEQTDGGIYERWQNLANYQTSVVLSFLSTLKDPAQEKRIARAQTFLMKLQYDAAESIDSDNTWYGGAGYNSTKRPDLSNTQMMLQALHDSGLPKDDPVYQKALKFVSRCQLNGATNDQPFAKNMTDGGFIYGPTDKGVSKAGPFWYESRSPLRSYGSMTYSGFKSMLYANVGRDDPRIKACLEWIRRNYTLDVNPGMPGRHTKEGLYYYYHVFAKALDAWGEPQIVDAAGKSHDWRRDLCDKLISLQRKDGSWENDKSRFNEGDADYVTALAILSLQTATRK